MSQVHAYLAIADQDQKAARDIAEGTAHNLVEGRLTLLLLIQSLGECLTDDNKIIRSQTVAYLSTILEFLPPSFLTRQQITVLCQFLCDRVEDASGLKEAAQGLTALQRQTRYFKDHAVKTTTAFFSIAQDFMRHPQGTRYIVYTSLNGLMTGHRRALQSMGDDFVTGITALVSGEKVPPNLMLVFSILRAVMIEWDISRHIEAMFDSVFCYFPITFRPQPNDPYGITAQDLKIRLKECLASNVLFVDFLFAALVDKLDASSVNVKRDVFNVFSACFETYDPAVIAPQALNLWDAMKFEILTPQDDKLTEDVLDALQGIPRCLARARPDGVDNQLLDGFLVSILKESMVRISEPQNRQAQGSIEILARMAGTSASAFRQIVPSLIEVLIKMINESDAIDKRMTCLGMLTTVLKSGVGSPIISQDYRATVLSGLKDQLFELYARCLMGTPVDRVSLRQSSIEGLLVLAAIDGLLKDSEFRICIGHLDSIILDEAPHGREAIQRTAIDALTTLAGLKAAIISEVALPKFLARLPDASRCNELSYIPILEALAQLSRERSLFEVICRRLIGRVQAIDRTPDQARFGSAMLAAIYRGLMEQKPVEGEGKSTGLEQALVEPLIRKFTESDSEDQSPWDHTLLNNLGRILSFMLSAMTLEDQKTTLTGLKLFRAPPDSSDPKELSTAWLFAGRKLKAHRLPSVQSAILAPWICAALQRSVEVSSMLECLQYLGTPSSYTAANTAAADLLEILVNKWPQYFEATAIPPIPILKPGVPGSEELGKLFRIYLQMIKGYVLRNHPSGVKLLESLLPALELPTQASSLAKAFGIILAPSQHLTRANHAVINPLHSQRLYTFLLPILSHKIRSPNTPTTSKLNHLTAFSQLVQFLPQTVLLQNIALSSPLLLQCLDLRDPGTRAATIKVLQRLLLAQPLDLESHTASIVTRLLASARLEFLDPSEVTAAAGAAAQEASPPHVRRAALKCLALMPGAMPLQTLMTVKRDVLQELRLALDDPRRSVRKEAVDCRTAWLRLDEPDEDG